MDILLTWVGARDPAWQNPRTKRLEPGPIISLLQSRRFDVVYLLLNLESKVDDFRQRATSVLRNCQRHFPTVRVCQKPVDLISVTDYREIFFVTNDAVQDILGEEGREGCNFFVYLSPGTPQMQTVWVLLVQSGLLPARMIESTPPDLLAPGTPRWREVDLTIQGFPQVVNPGETARLVGVLQARSENLAAENRRLRAENDLLRTGAGVSAGDAIPEGFQLREHLLLRERALYVLALERSRGNAAEAARLLGVDPPAFRARAATLGVRRRKKTAEGEA